MTLSPLFKQSSFIVRVNRNDANSGVVIRRMVNDSGEIRSIRTSNANSCTISGDSNRNPPQSKPDNNAITSLVNFSLKTV